MVQLTNDQHTCELVFKPRWTFWTYVMTVNLFPLYLMNFMFHTMLDATGIVLRVHYKSMKCDFLFSQGSIRTLFRRGGHFFHTWAKKISSSLQQCKNYKNWSRFSKVKITNVLPPFLWFTVYRLVSDERLPGTLQSIQVCWQWHICSAKSRSR